MHTQTKGSTPGPIEPPFHGTTASVVAHSDPIVPQSELPTCDPSEQTLADKEWTGDDEKRQRPVEPVYEDPEHAAGSAPSSTAGDGSSTLPSAHDDVTYPEGGLRAWLVVLGSFFGMLASFGMM